MKVIEESIRYPVTTAVGVILLLLFGGIALALIPVQLTPEVQRPTISVQTRWPGASPLEIEREIIQEQEDQLKSLESLLKMESSSNDSQGSITLTFPTGTDMDSALLRVSNRLQQVPEYPPDALRPVISSVGANDNAIAWFMIVPREQDGYEGDIAKLFDFIDDFIKPEIERVPGIAGSNIFGGREREMQVLVDPAKLAARRITLNELGAALGRENDNFSGGDFDEGKRRYIVRTIGEYEGPQDIDNIVIAVRDGVPVYVRDVGYAELGYRKASAKVFMLEQQAMAINAIREQGSNILDVMDRLKATIDNLNRNVLAPRGLIMIQSYDETQYVNSAIDLVQQSLIIGGILAVVILLLYLRSATSTLVIGVAIPISLVGVFLMMYVFGRTLNVISLAGMAFAVGMVVDNSIVVLENIYRHRQMGKTRYKAAYEGAREVWGAVLASTLTTVAVFVPVVFIEDEAGQLFGDIAVAISCAVALSLIVSITVIPSLSSKILGGAGKGERKAWRFGLKRFGTAFADGISSTVGWINRSIVRRIAVILLLTVTSLGLSWWLMPKTEYLPVGNNNFLFGVILPPPGYNVEETASIRSYYEEALGPLLKVPQSEEESAQMPGGGIQGFFFVATTNRVFMGTRARDPLRVRELLPAIEEASAKIPGTIVVTNQRSLFSRGFDEGRNIDVEITGPDLARLIELGGEVFGKVRQLMPEAQGRPIPSLDLGNPEVRVITDRRRAAEVGISNRELGFAVSALVDGAKASEYQYEGREIDLRVKAQETGAHRTHLLEQMPIATPRGELVTLSSVADVVQENGPVSINHRERQRAITIRITPAEQQPLEEAMELIEDQILAPMRSGGRLAGLYSASLSGTADKLAQTASTLQWNFLLALAITYLLMAALFESFLYPFVIMFSVPLAALGGFLGLAAVNAFIEYQALDVLTMLGFIILVGTVVNNAILIVHQSLNHMREEAMEQQKAIVTSVRSRIRPIFMSVSTSVFGMLPLVLYPGAGSELYRGLGSVVVGGLVFSTVFTLFLVPALLSLTLQMRNALARAIPVIAPEQADESAA
ncbi:MAG TPA: efflux RND transporter permease subunit [Acidobacteriota bacterium]|nr:efflux RND transporter permease subunit [Acidobacteriota bacterium]